MADSPASLEAVHAVVDALASERIPYAFIGGIALSVWGIPRATFDLDVAVSIALPQQGALLSKLEARGFVIDPAFLRGFRDKVSGMEKAHVHLAAGPTLMAVDLFFGTTPFLQSVLERRRAVDVGRGPISVCSAADLILLKLVADRPKDKLDVRNVLSVQGVPEREYLERWANELGVSDRLRAALAGV